MKTFRLISRVLLAVACVIALQVAGWYAWQDYQGARLWADTRRALEARGESLNSTDFIPPPVADAQNLALSPLFTRAYRYKLDPATHLLTFNPDHRLSATKVLDGIPYGLANGKNASPPMIYDWTSGHFLDLAKFQDYYRARTDFPRAPSAQKPADDVLLALGRYAPLLDELARAAATFPQTRFPVNWTQHPPARVQFPQYNFFQQVDEALRLRTCASLACGQDVVALRDLDLGFRLHRAMDSDPVVIAHLVDLTGLSLLLQPIWEGLAERRWSAAQLLALQTSLDEVDFLHGYRRAVQGERAIFLTATREDLHEAAGVRTELQTMTEYTGESPISGWIVTMCSLFPAGWADESAAVACRLQQQYCVDPVDVVAHRISAHEVEAASDFLIRNKMKPSTFLTRITLPVFTSVTVKTARVQAAVDQARVACALERFYLAHHVFPLPWPTSYLPAWTVFRWM